MYQRSDFHPRQVSHFAGKEGCESLLQPCPNLFRSEFLIHGSPPARRLVTQRGLPHIPRLHNDSISKCDSIRWKVFLYPSEGSGRNGTEEKYGAVILTEKINRG